MSLPFLVALAACGSTPPPRELLDAREAYRRAAAGPAPDLVPDKLYDAKKALDQANQAFEDDPKADRTRDYAYIAEREAR